MLEKEKLAGDQVLTSLSRIVARGRRFGLVPRLFGGGLSKDRVYRA